MSLQTADTAARPAAHTKRPSVTARKAEANQAPLPRVRVAVEADAPQLMELGRMLHGENAMMPLSEAHVSAAIWRAIHQDRIMVGVIGPVGAIEGMIALTIGQFWYTDKPHLEELFAFVRPDCRRSENAKALLEFAKSSACKFKVPLLIGIISNERTEAKVRMYQRQLGEPAGAYFLFNGKTGH